MASRGIRLCSRKPKDQLRGNIEEILEFKTDTFSKKAPRHFPFAATVIGNTFESTRADERGIENNQRPDNAVALRAGAAGGCAGAKQYIERN